ncbi:MAG: penicillin-binding protein activator [Paracoccaceae bacterium]
MLSVLSRACKPLVSLVRLLALMTLGLVLAACEPGTGPTVGGGGQGNGAPVAVALLVPGGSGEATDDLIARSLENAARLAIADLGDVKIDLRVYNTAASPTQAAAMATKAADDGAKIILGPFYALEANAAGAAVASRGINVLSFSNNPDIAGGNVFILGQTFDNTSRRLASYAVSKGLTRIMVVHDQNPAGEIGSAAIQRAVSAAGGSVAAVGGYEFSQSGIVAAMSGIATSAKSSNANAIFFTADTAGALPLVSQLLMENGVSPATTQFIGLTRWDIPSANLSLPGVQGGWFALPDPGLMQQYQTRYQAAYGEAPHPTAGFAYDGMAAIGALAKQGGGAALTSAGLTQGAGFVGVNGIFRFRGDGTNDRGLAVAQIQNDTVVIVDAAPRSFGGAGF